VVSFYELYVDIKASQKIFETYQNNSQKIPSTENILDEWIVARLAGLNEKVTDSMEKYELDSATRPIADFIDDLSTWYLRRSRDRFKGDNVEDAEIAKEVTHFVLINLAKIMAPFMPFMAEDIYQRVSGFKMNDAAKSVHLENWPSIKVGNFEKVLKETEEARRLVTLGLEARDKFKIKVRQPLQSIKRKDLSVTFSPGMISTILEELNVKEIIDDSTIESEVLLDSEITPELLEEGIAREIIRLTQSLRKKSDLNPEDKIDLLIETDEVGQKLIKKFSEQIKKPTNVVNFEFAENNGEVISVDNFSFKVVIK
jgi:isoleucyl-tRNA synthetase